MAAMQKAHSGKAYDAGQGLAWHRERSTSRLMPPRKLLSRAATPPRRRTGMTDADTSSWFWEPCIDSSPLSTSNCLGPDSTLIIKLWALLSNIAWMEQVRAPVCSAEGIWSHLQPEFLLRNVTGTFLRVCEELAAMVCELA